MLYPNEDIILSQCKNMIKEDNLGIVGSDTKNLKSLNWDLIPGLLNCKVSSLVTERSPKVEGLKLKIN